MSEFTSLGAVVDDVLAGLGHNNPPTDYVQLPKAYVQDAVADTNMKLSTLQRLLGKWRDSAFHFVRQIDPAHIVIKLREMAAVLNAKANEIEAEMQRAAKDKT